MSLENIPDDERLISIVEALLFASGEVVRLKDLVAAVDGIELPQIELALETLSERYEREHSGLRVEHVGGGVQLATRSEVGPWVRQMFRNRNRTRISIAGLETLAIIAYRQPITAPEIQSIRGKDPSGPLKTLLEKKLVKILGRKKVVGNPILYGTSKFFLAHFGLDNLKELPPIEAFEEFVEGLEALEIGGDAQNTPTTEEIEADPELKFVKNELADAMLVEDPSGASH